MIGTPVITAKNTISRIRRRFITFRTRPESVAFTIRLSIIQFIFTVPIRLGIVRYHPFKISFGRFSSGWGQSGLRRILPLFSPKIGRVRQAARIVDVNLALGIGGYCFGMLFQCNDAARIRRKTFQIRLRMIVRIRLDRIRISRKFHYTFVGMAEPQ